VSDRPDASVLARRLERAAAATGEHALDGLLITPGPDLTYLTGYRALPLERLTCLVLRGNGEAVLVVPRLEAPAAEASAVGQLGIDVLAWDETESPFALVASLLPAAGTVGVDDAMAAAKVLRLREAMPKTRQSLASAVLRHLRMRKDHAEIESLRQAGAAIDRVHAGVGEWLRPGRTEAEVGRDIADAILAEGHERVDFVIVASGPNGASPHHELSERVIQPGDPVVVDIGGTMPSGYCSDSTRTYAVGEPPVHFTTSYAVLHEAQARAVGHVRPGVTAASVDTAARSVIAEAGYGDRFIHRTGHGIGLETHEEPYIVAGNDEPVDVGMAFSIEPGIYTPGQHGARIEDIVVVTEHGAQPLNLRPRELVIV
jgi:Xaa-Pro aminopeptidase